MIKFLIIIITCMPHIIADKNIIIHTKHDKITKY